MNSAILFPSLSIFNTHCKSGVPFNKKLYYFGLIQKWYPMKKEMKRLFIKYLGKRYAVNTVKILEPGKTIYDLITIIDLETNKLAFENQKLNLVTLDTRESSPTLFTSLIKDLPKDLITAIKNGIMNEYHGRVQEYV
jgi:hypothetical protein